MSRFDDNPVIARLREGRKLDEVSAAKKALELWRGFTDNEKTAVRLGMFPLEKIQQAEADLCAVEVAEAGHLLCVALMECASRDGGMRA